MSKKARKRIADKAAELLNPAAGIPLPDEMTVEQVHSSLLGLYVLEAPLKEVGQALDEDERFTIEDGKYRLVEGEPGA